MESSLVPIPRAEIPLSFDAKRLVEAFLSGRSTKTIRAYRQDLEYFAKFLGEKTLDAAADQLLSQSHGKANTLALTYKTHLFERELAPATINRRLAALRSLVKLARTLGIIPWTMEVQNIRSEPYRDTRGPGRYGFLMLLDELSQRSDAKGKRDVAALRLLYDLAFRRSEVCQMDLEDVDLDTGTVAVLGKGRTEKKRFTLPSKSKRALAAWLEVRGQEPGPLFINYDRAGKGQRLTTNGLYRMVRKLGEQVGVKARPHGLRHAAITEALDLTHGNLRSVAKFSRHKDVRVLNVYDDNRTDIAGEVAHLVSDRA